MADEKKTLEDHGIFPFCGAVEPYHCLRAMQFIWEANLAKPRKPRTSLALHINSDGGAVADGFALIDVMAASAIPIRTFGYGALGSMGLLIFIAGLKGHRGMSPNTLVLSHQHAMGFEEGSSAKSHEIASIGKRASIIDAMFMRHYRQHTGLSKKKIRKYLLPPHDVYLTAKEALKLGLCDSIME